MSVVAKVTEEMATLEIPKLVAKEGIIKEVFKGKC